MLKQQQHFPNHEIGQKDSGFTKAVDEMKQHCDVYQCSRPVKRHLASVDRVLQKEDLLVKRSQLLVRRSM